MSCLPTSATGTVKATAPANAPLPMPTQVHAADFGASSEMSQVGLVGPRGGLLGKVTCPNSSELMQSQQSRVLSSQSSN